MNNPAKTQPVTPPAVTSGPLTLRLEPDAKISVAVLPPDKPTASLSRNLYFLIVAFFLLAAIWIRLYLVYVQPVVETPQPLRLDDAKLAVAFTYPGYATYRDELELTLHVTNYGSREFTGALSLVFIGGVPAYPLPGDQATVKLDKLAAGAALSHRLRFALRYPTPWWASGYHVATELRATNDTTAFAAQNGPAIAVAPHGWPLRTINIWFSNSGLLLAVAALLWEVVRKRFFGWEAKG